MIIANMATYPPRRDGAIRAARALAPQLGRLNLVLNQFAGPIAELVDLPNVNQIIPEEDTKDVGKFYPVVSGGEYVLTVDDDLIYPDEFVKATLSAFSFGRGYMGGYHASLYQRPQFSLRAKKFIKWTRYTGMQISNYRKVFHFQEALESPIVVDQIGTGAAIMFAEDFPPYEYMRDSQKFVDVRLARWCFEHAITPVALPRPRGWLGEVRYDETIFESFTQANPPEVSREIMTYAFKVPGRGSPPPRSLHPSEQKVF